MPPPRPSSSSTNGSYNRYESKMSPHAHPPPPPGLNIKSSPLSDESPSERLSQSKDTKNRDTNTYHKLVTDYFHFGKFLAYYHFYCFLSIAKN